MSRTAARQAFRGFIVALILTHSPRLRLELAVADSVVDDIVDSIIVAAGRGSSTDLRTCHVFVLLVEEWGRFPDLESSKRSSKGEDRIRSHRGGVYHVTPYDLELAFTIVACGILRNPE
jgi:hypothetical protein